METLEVAKFAEFKFEVEESQVDRSTVLSSDQTCKLLRQDSPESVAVFEPVRPVLSCNRESLSESTIKTTSAGTLEMNIAHTVSLLRCTSGFRVKLKFLLSIRRERRNK